MKAIIFVRVVKAWIVGLVFAGMVVVPLNFALITAVPHESLSDLFVSFIAEIPSGSAAVLIFGVVLSLPLLLIAYLVALWCRNLIAENPLFFTFLAPFVTATIVALYFNLTADDAWKNSTGFWSRFGHIYFTRDVWIFGFSVLASATYYCFYLRHIQRTD